MTLLLSDIEAGVGSATLDYLNVTADTTLDASTSNRKVLVNSANTINLALPASNVKGWYATVIRYGPGAVNLSLEAGASAVGPFGVSAISTQYGQAMVEVVQNDDGAAAVYLVSGLTT